MKNNSSSYLLPAHLKNSLVEIHYFESCKSTNLECLKLNKHKTVFITDRQTKGRGRRGKVWHSPDTNNIYCSIGLQKKLNANHIGLISLQVGVSIVKILHQQGFNAACLKWPNDILYDHQKLGGILIETQVISEDEFFLSIGFGLNVSLGENDLTTIDQPAISLNQINHSVDRSVLLALIVDQIIDSVQSFDKSCVESLLYDFNQLDTHQGKPVTVKLQNAEIEGDYLGVEKTGQIKVLTEHGVELFSSAEISLRGNESAFD